MYNIVGKLMKSQIFGGKNVKKKFFTFFFPKGQGAPGVVLGEQGRSKSGAGRPAPLFWPRDITGLLKYSPESRYSPEITLNKMR